MVYRLRWTRVAAFAVVLGALAGCRLDLTAEATLSVDGSGRAEVAATFDEELLTVFDELELDPTAGVEAAAAAGHGWQVDRQSGDDGALTVSLSKDVDTPEQLGAAFAELSDGLSEEDPTLLLDIEVALADDGTATVAGQGMLRPPASIGVALDDEPVGPDAAALAELVDTHVETTFALTLPGDIGEHDADSVDGQTATWQLPTDEPRAINAQAHQPAWWQEPLVLWSAAGGGAVLVLALGSLMLMRRRRRDRRRKAPATPGG